MDKRYQVFVSSTFKDLVVERRAVIQALLELNCIPAGMEMFPASSDDNWTLIQRVIDDCDYYLVIIGGRYGSLDAAGVSYTEKEYDYALSTGKPVLGFLHGEPDSLPVRNTDQDPRLMQKLLALREKVQQRHCRFWSSAEQLGGVVSRSYVQLLRTHPAEGWVKARHIKTPEDFELIATMHNQIRTLERELEATRRLSRPTAANLCQGDDKVALDFVFQDEGSPAADAIFLTTWNEIFELVGSACVDKSSTEDIRDAMQLWIQAERNLPTTPRLRLESFESVKIQFISLGLIDTVGTVIMEVGNPHPRQLISWALTADGRTLLGDLRAAKRELTI